MAKGREVEGRANFLREMGWQNYGEGGIDGEESEKKEEGKGKFKEKEGGCELRWR